MAGVLPASMAGLSVDDQSPMKLYYNVLDGVDLHINNKNYQRIWISTEPQDLAIPGPIVFLGEGNFTFCTAFAAYRSSWQGIVPTTLYADAEQQTREMNCELVTTELADWKGTLTDCCSTKVAGTLSTNESMRNWKAQVANCTPPVRHNLDATDMGEREALKKKLGISPTTDHITLWFQHPWRSGDNQGRMEFLRNVVSSAASVQNADELFLMGLCTDHMEQYSELLQHLQTTGYSYQCVGVDTEFVSNMVGRGYQNSCDCGNFATFLLRRTACATVTQRRLPIVRLSGHETINRTAHQADAPEAPDERNNESELDWTQINAAPLKINDENYGRIKLSVHQPNEGLASETFVFLGEGKFYFCTAFAASRGSWHGVVPTNYIPSEKYEKRKTFEAFEKYRNEWKATLSACCEHAKSKELQSMVEWKCAVARYTPPVRRHLDATDMGTRQHFAEELGVDDKSLINLWFQCPWERRETTNNFLNAIFASAANVQVEQERLLIGVCVDERYVNAYGNLQAAAQKDNYTCHGADQEFVGEMLSRGYKHRSYSDEDLGLDKSEYFATLVFTKNRETEERKVFLAPLHPVGTLLYAKLMSSHPEQTVSFCKWKEAGFEYEPEKVTKEKWTELNRAVEDFFSNPSKEVTISQELSVQGYLRTNLTIVKLLAFDLLLDKDMWHIRAALIASLFD